jgi:hypothetical protein
MPCEKGSERKRENERVGEREGGREGGRVGGRKGERERGRERGEGDRKGERAREEREIGWSEVSKHQRGGTRANRNEWQVTALSTRASRLQVHTFEPGSQQVGEL